MLIQELVYRFIIGGICVAVIGLLAQKGMTGYAGILMTFPVITIISLIMSNNKSAELAKAGLLGLVSAASFIIAFILLVKYNRCAAIAAGVLAWVVVSVVILTFLPKI